VKLLYSAREAADALAIDISLVYRLAADGHLEKRYIGAGRTSFRIPADSLEAYVKSLPTEPRTT
jgi:excisionase family DNA binding protein